MARDKKRKKSHGTPKANHQKKQVKRVMSNRSRDFSDKVRKAKGIEVPIPSPVNPTAIAEALSGAAGAGDAELLSDEGAETVVDLFGSVYNMMHAG